MIFGIFAGLVIIFGSVLLFGAPYLPTQREQTRTALELLNLKKGQTLFELGSGDGRVAKQAAKKGWKVVAYELNPILVLISKVTTWRYRKQVKIIWGDFWKSDLSKADGIYTFLLDRFMPKLDKKLQKEITKPVPLVSYAFRIPEKKIAKEKNGLFLYRY